MSSVYAAQPREGTETILVAVQDVKHCKRFMQLNPARGRKLKIVDHKHATPSNRFMQLNPARGRKRIEIIAGLRQVFNRFMQLNPARGRKLTLIFFILNSFNKPRFMQLNPARGRKPSSLNSWQFLSSLRFMQLNPARGRKHDVSTVGNGSRSARGLCSSTPRGDGNMSGSFLI